MKILFWTCWIIEAAAVFFWIAKEISHPYEPNPLACYLGLYLMIALACRFAFDVPVLSTAMVALPAFPLFIVATFFSFTPYNEIAVKHSLLRR